MKINIAKKTKEDGYIVSVDGSEKEIATFKEWTQWLMTGEITVEASREKTKKPWWRWRK